MSNPTLTLTSTLALILTLALSLSLSLSLTRRAEHVALEVTQGHSLELVFQVVQVSLLLASASPPHDPRADPRP